MQAALAVMNRGMRPEIPPHTPPPFARMMQSCWAPTPDQRPDFGWVVAELEAMAQVSIPSAIFLSFGHHAHWLHYLCSVLFSLLVLLQTKYHDPLSLLAWAGLGVVSVCN